MAKDSSRYATVHAHIIFTEDYEARSIKTGTLVKYEAGMSIDPVQIEHNNRSADPLAPTTVWTDEAETGTCFDFVYIPGSVVEIVDHWPA